MKTLLIITWLGNVVDMISTLCLVNRGYIELNPIMRALLGFPVLFAFVKITAMTAVVIWLWEHREDKRSVVMATMSATVYGSLAVYYLLAFANAL